MKKLITILIMILLLGYIFLVKRVTINIGEEAVVIKKPWFFGVAGIERNPIMSGTLWAFTSTEIKKISLKTFLIEESFKELFTIDNIPLSLNLSLAFKNKKGQSVRLIEKFGEQNEWYKNLLHKPLQKSLEIAIRKRTLKEIADNNSILNDIKQDILFGVKDFLNKQNIPVELLDITFGKISPPKEIVQMAIDVEVEKKNLTIQKLRKKVIEAKAEVDRAYMQNMNMLPKEYLKMKQIELEKQKLSIQRFAIENAKDSNGSIKIEIKMERL